MDTDHTLLALSALSQETRLAIFKLLVKHTPDGLIAGDISLTLSARQNTISTHLSILERSGWIESHREGRSIRYTANLQTMRNLVEHLLQDCCGESAENCTPILNSIFCECK